MMPESTSDFQLPGSLASSRASDSPNPDSQNNTRNAASYRQRLVRSLMGMHHQRWIPGAIAREREAFELATQQAYPPGTSIVVQGPLFTDQEDRDFEQEDLLFSERSESSTPDLDISVTQGTLQGLDQMMTPREQVSCVFKRYESTCSQCTTNL
jgi:hypothetical protein